MDIESWEYRVQSFGATLRYAKDEEIEAELNRWGEDGWEVIASHFVESTTKVRFIAKRPLITRTRRERSRPS